MFYWYFTGIFNTYYIKIAVNIRHLGEKMEASQFWKFMNDPRTCLNLLLYYSFKHRKTYYDKSRNI